MGEVRNTTYVDLRSGAGGSHQHAAPVRKPGLAVDRRLAPLGGGDQPPRSSICSPSVGKPPSGVHPRFRQRVPPAASRRGRRSPSPRSRPMIDEEAIKAELLGAATPPQDIAGALAEAKALHVAAFHPSALVLGADQTLLFENEVIGKCPDLAAARRLLKRLRGREHHLVGGYVLARGEKVLWRHGETAKLVLRDFSDAFLDVYLAAEGEAVLSAVGCYKLEGLGAQLFASVRRRLFFDPGPGTSSRCWHNCGRRVRAEDMDTHGRRRVAGIIGWPVAQAFSAAPARILARGIRHRRRAGAAGGPSRRTSPSRCAASWRQGSGAPASPSRTREAAFALVHDCDLAGKSSRRGQSPDLP